MLEMTKEQASEIIRTYKLPMTEEQLALFKKAMAICVGAFRLPESGE
jgi:hypothetical protein